MLKRGHMPEEIYIVILGEIQILGQTREEKLEHEIITIRTDPGTRTETLIQQGREYGQLLCTREIKELQENVVTMIGEECDLLGLASPYSYIVKSKTLAYTIKVETFYSQLLQLNPLGLEELKTAASKKLKEINHIARQKKDWDKTVGDVASIR